MLEKLLAFINSTTGLASYVSTSAPLPVQTVAPSTSVCAFVRGFKAPASLAVPEALAADGTFVTTVTIVAIRAARVANATSVWIDAINTNDIQSLEMAPGSFYTFTAPPGKVIDLNDIYVDATTLTDGVYFVGML